MSRWHKDPLRQQPSLKETTLSGLTLSGLPPKKHIATLEAVLHLLQQTVRAESLRDVGAACLQAAMKVTESTAGFLGRSHGGVLDTLIVEPDWNQCVTINPLQGLPIRGLWSVPFQAGVVFYTNNPQSHPGWAKTQPSGHPKIECFLGAPLMLRDEAWGVMGLANKPGGYDEDDRSAIDILVSAFLEVLPRAQAEESLRETQARFASLFDMTPSGIAIYQAVEDGEDFVFVDINPAVERIEGIHREDLIGRCVTECFPGVEEMGLFKVFQRVYRSGQTEHHTDALYRDDKRSGWRDNHVVRLPSGEIVAIYEDITGRKCAETNLQSLNETLRQSNEELEQFAYAASHDLREPLNKITAFGQRFQSRFGSDLEPKAAEYLDVMVTASGRLDGLINDLLDFSRAGRDQGSMMEVPLDRVLEEALEDLSESIASAGAEIRVHPGLPAVHGHTHHIRQLFENLISNAIKFRHPERSPVVAIRGTVVGRQIVITVDDNGIGFDPKFNDEIFRIFHRLHSRFEYPGTGVGLALCRRIANRYGGSIVAEGKPGEGSTFRLTLPLA
jgi:PAS domain S-box-containing protein